MSIQHSDNMAMNLTAFPFFAVEEAADPFEQMTAALYEVDQVFDTLFEHYQVNYADFDRYLKLNDVETAHALAMLWEEINNDIAGQYQEGGMARFAWQRWLAALSEWKETIMSAVHNFSSSNIYFDLRIGQSPAYDVAA